jgi:hypothetical protein
MTKFADPGHALVRAVSDDLAKTQGRIEEMGGQFFFDLGNDAEKESFGRKFKDPDGVILDIAQKGWQGTNA